MTVVKMISMARVMMAGAVCVALPVQTIYAQTGARHPTLRLDVPHSYNPIDAYRPASVPLPDLANSARIDALVHDGVLELSLNDAIELALENNLDLAIARYNIPIAQADVLRTKAGGVFRGVNTGVVQNTPGGGVGGLRLGRCRCGRGRNFGWRGWRGLGSFGAGAVDAGLGIGGLFV